MYKNILLFLFFLLCAGCLFSVSQGFVEAYTTPKWFWFIFAGAALITVYLLFAPSKKKEKVLADEKILSGVSLIVISLCSLQAIYGILQYIQVLPANEGHRLTGSFDNPAGFAASLTAGFPFAFYFFQKHKISRLLRGLSIAAMGLIVIAVVLSASRAGVLSLAVIGMAILFYKVKIKTRTKVIASLMIAVVLVGGLYWLKKDSADGRLLVWQCCLDMIKEKPVLGYGPGGFTANYMNFQETYFREHPDSPYAMLADTVTHPFNEYFLLAIDYGLIGLVLFLSLIAFITYSFIKNKEKNTIPSLAALAVLSILTFAFFSYPFRYPFVWVVGLLSVSIIISQAGYKIQLPAKVGKWTKIIVVLLLVVTCLFAYSRRDAERRWTEVAHRSLNGQTEEMMPFYAELKTSLSGSHLFLYNYAAELNVIERYKESIEIAHECEKLWADYDVQLLLGDNYQRTRQYDKALYHLDKAFHMCPVRFIPLHRMYRIYSDMGNHEKAEELGRQILNKPVKVMSSDIKRIKEDVTRTLPLKE